MKSRSSASSVYDDATEEEEERMEVEMGAKSRLRKRRLSSGQKESKQDDATKQRRGNDMDGSGLGERREMERIEQELRRKRSEEMKRSEAEKEKRRAEEERKREKVEERRKPKERETKTRGENIDNVRKNLWSIMTAIERETGGKISFTRGDQTAVRMAVYEIQNGMIGLMKKVMEAEEKVYRLEQEKRDGQGQTDARRRDRGVVLDTSDSEEWQQIWKVRRQPRTYAQVSAGVLNVGERLEGRVVVTGKEGWKTPPSRQRGERALIVSSAAESDARKLADSLAKSISVKDIGGRRTEVDFAFYGGQKCIR